MAVRNFYVKANIDGRETTLAGGPANKDGGMRVNIYQRDNNGGGTEDPIIEIVCAVLIRDGKRKLITRVYDDCGNELREYISERK